MLEENMHCSTARLTTLLLVLLVSTDYTDVSCDLLPCMVLDGEGDLYPNSNKFMAAPLYSIPDMLYFVCYFVCQ